MLGLRPLVICLLALAPSLAAAQPDDALAKQYFKLGEELYNRADYDGALKQFQKSYEISKKPALLFNMARCQESLGQHEKAIELLTEYLKSNPRNADLVEARIANLRKLVERRQPSEVKQPPVSAPASVAAPPIEQPVVPPPPPPARSRPLRLTGWVLVGAGGALLVSGIALGVVAQNKANELEEANRSRQEYSTVKSKESSQRTFRNAAIGTLVAGGLLAVGGGVLLVLDWRSARAERRAFLLPSFGPEHAGLVGEIRF